jgi:2-oxoglutarate ferredoxin oxidoreductase subunit gamma
MPNFANVPVEVWMFKSAEIRLSGSGGQGLILAGIILANAAVHDKRRVTQTQSYGPESRGGYSRADVIISDKEIFFPEATQFDILMALTQEACDKYIYDIKEKGILIVDTYEIPFTEIVSDKLGSPITTNICSIAFLVKCTGIVKEESLRQAIKDSVKPAFIDLNLKAMQLGFELAEKYRK